MTSKLFSRLTPLAFRFSVCSPVCRSLSSGQNLTVDHDRHNRRFTVAPGRETGKQTGPALTLRCWGRSCSQEDHAVLHYRFTGEQEVDLMSTYVPEIFRGRGVAALLSQAALDFVVEENLKAHVSCWYIKKYIEENPEHHYKECILT
ncbi:protein NATD1-like isoform X1 [Labrus mixtus]|uniref:protein NATD1-like isoform X1 n=1 Tax=Labrus mixtus TaxID=508554 RepID=UPI0029C0E023|nr:protein NATD1-like isoform X1 [Labrus mixtus]